MAYRILIQLFFFLLPFLAYGLYRLLVADAEADGRKAWPVHVLFALGAALTAGVYVFFVVNEPKQRGLCYEPARFEDGELIPGRQVPCEQDVSRVGLPGERHERAARGVDPGEGDAAEIAAESPGTTRGPDGLPEPRPLDLPPEAGDDGDG